MKFFVLAREPHRVKPKRVLGIDPGLTTMGMCMVELAFSRMPSLWMHTDVEEGLGVLKTPLPKLLGLVRKTIRKRVLERIWLQPGSTDTEKLLYWYDCCVVIEAPHMSGQFSLGLSLVIAELVQLFWYELNVSSIVFLPNNIPQFLLKESGVKDSEIKKWVAGLFPNMKIMKEKIHAVEALLNTMMVAPNHFESVYGIRTRRQVDKPTIEYITHG